MLRRRVRQACLGFAVIPLLLLVLPIVLARFDTPASPILQYLAPTTSAAACPTAINLVNSGFESPVLPANDATTPAGWTNLSRGAWYIPDADVPGWNSSIGEFEIWKSGRQNGVGGPAVPSYAGNQFAELNARSPGTVYQDFNTTAYQGTTFTYSFAHRGRNGADTMAIDIGPGGGAAANFTRQVTTGSGSWAVYTGSYRVPEGQTTTRFAYRAVNAVGGPALGNFLDEIRFGTPTCNVDLSVTKTTTMQQYVPGAPVTWDVVVRNSGTFDVTGAPFADSVPAGVTSVTWTCTASAGSTCGGSGSGSGNSIARNLNILAGGTVTFRITGTAPTASAPANLANTSTIQPPSGITDPTPSNNTSTVTTPLARASINIAKTTLYTGPVTEGDQFVYRFTVTNDGTVPLTGITITDPRLPAETISCPQTTLGVNQSIVCTAPYTVTAQDMTQLPLTNTATVTGTPPGTMTPPTASSTLTIDGSPQPSLYLSKSVTPSTGLLAGDRVTYTFTVVNTGNVSLTGIRINDPLPNIGAITCQTTTLAPGQSTTCSATYVVTQANVNAGTVPNTATVTGTPPAPLPAVQATASTSFTTYRSAGIRLEKSSSSNGALVAGQVLTYRFLVTNTGTVSLTGVSVTDPMPGLSTISCPGSTIQPGLSITCTATYTVTPLDVDAGVIRNTATATGTPSGGGSAVTSQDTEESPSERFALLRFDKTVTPSAGVVAGDIVTFSFFVYNAGNVSLSNVAVTDTSLPGMSVVNCPRSTLAAGDSMTCSATYRVTQANVDAGGFTNSASVTGTPPAGVTAPIASDTASVTTNGTPGIRIDKSSDATTLITGDTVTFTYTVTNTGTVSLTDVAVTDTSLPGLSGLNCPANRTLASGASFTCTATYTVTQDDVDAGVLANLASATGTPPGNLTPPSDSDDEIITATRTADIAITKSASPDSGIVAGQTVRYTYTVTNTGNVRLSNVTVTDDRIASGIDCAGTGTNLVPTLVPDGTVTCVVDYTVTQNDVDTNSAGARIWRITNTATVTGTPPGSLTTPTGSAQATIEGSRVSSIDVNKESSWTGEIAAGSTVTYTFTLTNTGQTTLSNVTLIDTTFSDLVMDCDPAIAGDQPAPTTLAPAQTVTCTGTHVVTQPEFDGNDITNTVTATATTPGGATVTDTDAETILSDPDPSISIAKSTTTTTFVTDDEIVYTVLVTNTGNATLNEVAVADSLADADLTCPAELATLDPGESQQCTVTYTATQEDVDSGSIENTASVTAQPATPDYPELTGQSSVTIPANRVATLSLVKSASPATDVTVGTSVDYTFTVTNTGTVSLDNVVISDPLAGLDAITCDQGTGTEIGSMEPLAVVTCTSSYSISQQDVDRGHVTNIATVGGDPRSGGERISTSDSTSVLTLQNAGMNLTKTVVEGPAATSAGDTVTYRFEVENTGNVTLSVLGITDPKLELDGYPCIGTLPPGQSLFCTAQYTLTQDDVDAGVIENTATAESAVPPGSTETLTDTDDHTYLIERSPSIEIVKSSSFDEAVLTEGDVVPYTYTVENIGNVTLTEVTVTDIVAGGGATVAIACPVDDGDGVIDELAPGTIVTCTSSHTVSSGDVETGTISNTATVTGTTPEGSPPLEPQEDSFIVPADPSAVLRLTKAASPASGLIPGDEVTYTFRVRNTGTTALTNVVLSDTTLPAGTDITCSQGTGGTIGTIAYASFVDCTATMTVTQEMVDTGNFTNTATVSADGATPIEATATITASQVALIEFDKAITSSGPYDLNDVVTYSFTATNTGTVSLANTTITDPMFTSDDLECAIGETPVENGTFTLQAGEAVVCSADHPVNQDDIDAGEVTNNASITGTPPGELPAPSDSGTATFRTLQSPGITLDKTELHEGDVIAGTVITFNYVITNSGNLTLTNVNLADAMPSLGPIECDQPLPVAELIPEDTVTCSATYTVSQDDVDAGSISNTADASGTPPNNLPRITDDGTVTIPTTQTAALTLTKSALPTEVTEINQEIIWTFEVTYTGSVTVTGLTISDALTGIGPVTCDKTTLNAPADSTTCRAPYLARTADFDTGTIENSASAHANGPSGVGAVDSGLASATVTAVASPSFTFTKVANVETYASTTETIIYTLTLTNTGNSTLTGSSITDDLFTDSLICSEELGQPLPPNESVSCNVVHQITQDDLNSGSITNTGTGSIDGLDPITSSVTVTAARSPALTVEKSADRETAAAVGDQIAYTITVRNTGNVTLNDVTVTDPLVAPDAIDCDGTGINVIDSLEPFTGDPGENPGVACILTYTVDQDDVDSGGVINTAQAVYTPSGGDPTGPVESGEVTVTIPRNPELTVVKGADLTTVSAVDEVITYTFTITNSGNVTLENIDITDALPNIGDITCDGPLTALPPAGEGIDNVLECSATYTVTQEDLDRGTIDNEVTVEADPIEGAEPVATDEHSVDVDQQPAIRITKTASPETLAGPGNITWTITVTNSGNVTLSDISVTDSVEGADPVSVDCPSSGPLRPADAPIVCTVIQPVSQDDFNADADGMITNTASVSATAPGAPEPVQSSADAQVALDQSSALGFEKSSDFDGQYLVEGETITYTFRIENRGTQTLTNVVINDSRIGVEDLLCAEILEPQASTSCTAGHVVNGDDMDAGQISNTATASANPPGGGNPIEETSTINVPQALAPALALSKSADPASGVNAGDTITYTLVVTNTGNVRLRDVAIQDELIPADSISCDTTVIDPNQSATCTGTYLVTQDDFNAGAVVNTASVSANPPAGLEPPTADASVTVPTTAGTTGLTLDKRANAENDFVEFGDIVTYEFVVGNSGTTTITDIEVIDDLPGLSAIACPVRELGPGESMTCSATYPVTETDIQNGAIRNTASAIGYSGQGTRVESTDNVDIRACATNVTPEPTPTDDGLGTPPAEEIAPTEEFDTQALVNCPELPTTPTPTAEGPVVQPTRDPGNTDGGDGGGNNGGGDSDGGGNSGGDDTNITTLPSTGNQRANTGTNALLIGIAIALLLAAAGATALRSRRR